MVAQQNRVTPSFWILYFGLGFGLGLGLWQKCFSLCNLDCSLIFLNPILASVSSFHCDVKTLQKWIWTLHDDNECFQLMYNSVTMMSLLRDDNPALIGLLQISQHDCFKLLSWDKSEEGESKPTKITFNSSNNNKVAILSPIIDTVGVPKNT